MLLVSICFGQSENSTDNGFSGLVDIGGRSLYLECRGQGAPTVVLEAGYRSPATVWSDDLVQPDAPRQMVFGGVAAFSRVCLYERPGAGTVLNDVLVPSRSDPVPQPRMMSDMVADLHALLQAASVPGPYVLVGHSLGGALVRLYEAAYPDEVVGMVLVDAGHEDLFVQEQALLGTQKQRESTVLFHNLNTAQVVVGVRTHVARIRQRC